MYISDQCSSDWVECQLTNHTHGTSPTETMYENYIIYPAPRSDLRQQNDVQQVAEGGGDVSQL